MSWNHFPHPSQAINPCCSSMSSELLYSIPHPRHCAVFFSFVFTVPIDTLVVFFVFALFLSVVDFFDTLLHFATGFEAFLSTSICLNGDDVTLAADSALCFLARLTVVCGLGERWSITDLNQAESRPVKFNSCNNEVYNSLFSMDELRDAIFKSQDTTTRPMTYITKCWNTFFRML